MTIGIIGLVAAYILLAILLLSLNLRSAWPWPVKAGAIMLTTGFFAASFLAIEAMLGWPTEALPPERFELHAALIREPDRRDGTAGAIFLWLSPRSPEGDLEPPRAYALPYSRELHEAAARAQAQLKDGRRVEGLLQSETELPFGWQRQMQVQLFEAPPPRLPPKTS